MISVFFNNNSRGPGKVAKNLILGLNKLGVDYDINPTNVSDNDKIISLQRTQIMNTPHITHSIIGPNICILPIENPIVMGMQYKKMIVPSQWVKDKYMKWLPEDKLFIWAVGIDTDQFSDKSEHEKTNDCLIYYKNRSEHNLQSIQEFLTKKGQSFEVIRYGSYNENQFINTISRSKYGIVVGNTESQGIAIQEMMSSNLPLLIWDVTIWDGMGPNYIVPATTVPYWDDICGVKFYKFDELDDIFNSFISKYDTFNPREYIINNLSLEKKANDLLEELNK